MNRKLGIKAIVVAVLMTSAAVAPVTPPTLAVNGCSLFNNVTGRYEVDSQSDLVNLGTDISCRGREIHQTADIELNGWNTPIFSWYGTFNGGGFRIKDDVSPASQSPLFWNPPGSISINNVHRSGNVTHNDIGSGGFVGYSEFKVTIARSSMTGNVNGTGGYVGGFVGVSLSGPTASVEITGSSMNGAVTGNSPVGGFVGGTEGPVTISASSRIGPTSGSGAVGGLVGVAQDSFHGARGAVTITGSYSTGNVSATGANAGGSFGAGGFVATAQDVTIESSYTTSSVSIAGVGAFNNLGGFVAYTDTFTVSQSFTSGDVTDTSEGPIRRVGGFVGVANVRASISDSFATGDVIGSAAPEGPFTSTGGLIGLSNGTGSTITRTYTTGDVIRALTTSLGFVGDLWGDPVTVTNSFCRDGATSCGVDDPAAAKTSSELKSRDFLHSRGWNFDQVWCVRDALNDGYPVLRAIDFGPGDTSICRPLVPIWRASLDPNGGTCVDGSIRSKAWTSVFVGYRYLPGATDCTRPGHTFAGWADQTTPSTIKALPLLMDPSSNTRRYFAAQDLDLIAVWTPDAASTITDLVVFANFLCGPCTTAWLIYTSPPDITSVTITADSNPVTCNRSGVVFGLSVCELTNVTPGSHTITLTPTGGRSTTTTFVLRG